MTMMLEGVKPQELAIIAPHVSEMLAKYHEALANLIASKAEAATGLQDKIDEMRAKADVQKVGDGVGESQIVIGLKQRSKDEIETEIRALLAIMEFAGENPTAFLIRSLRLVMKHTLGDDPQDTIHEILFSDQISALR